MAEINRPGASVLHTIYHRLPRHVLMIGIVLIAGIIAYSKSLNGPFQFDDFNISDKAQVFSRASTSTTRQLADFSFLLNHYINGTNVFSFHLLNLMIHLCSAVTIYFLVAELILALAGIDTENNNKLQFISQFIPAATAMLFVCHPIQTQAVTYIVQRYTSMATLFYLLSTLLFIKARISHINGAFRINIWLAGIGSVISGLIAMRCKEIAFTLPVMLVIVELFVFHGRLLRSKIFLSCMAALLFIVPVQQILRHGNVDIMDLIYLVNKGSREELTYSRMDYFLTQLRVIVTYVRLLLFPINQNLDYDYPFYKTIFTVPVVLSLLFHIFMLTSAAVMFFKSRLIVKNHNVMNRTCVRLCSLGIIWFYVALLVESSFVPILDVIFEHRIYLPSFGFFLVIVSASARFLAHSGSPRRCAWISLAVICLILTTATIRRNNVWNDCLLLWEDTASKSPHKLRVLNNLAAIYLQRNMPEKAIAPLLHVLDIEPGYTRCLNSLGMLLDQIPQAKGRYYNGKKYIISLAEVNVSFIDPWFANTRNNLGLVYELKGDRIAALGYYEQAAYLAPKDEAPWINIALLSAQQGNKQRAVEAVNKLKQLNPQRAKKVESYVFSNAG